MHMNLPPEKELKHFGQGANDHEHRNNRGQLRLQCGQDFFAAEDVPVPAGLRGGWNVDGSAMQG